jgi:hypothetical protein
MSGCLLRVVQHSAFEINSTDDSKRIVWTPGEITAKEVPLTAKLVETCRQCNDRYV